MTNTEDPGSGRAQTPRQKVQDLKDVRRRRQRRRRSGIIGGACVLALGAGALTVALRSGADKVPSMVGSPGGAASSVLAPVRAPDGSPVDGIQSGSMEQLAFHIHAHLSIFINGVPRTLPYGIGIIPPYRMTTDADGTPFAEGGRGIYWLHTHDSTGIIHMEAPAQFSFTLGEFFDLWGQPLTPTQVGPAHGAVTVLVNGRVRSGDPRDVPLNAHDVIQLDLGTVVPFQGYTFPQGL